MSRITKKDRLHLLEMASAIAAEGAKNTNVIWMIEFQEQLVETLYRKMSALLESDLERCGDEDEDEDEAAGPKPAEWAGSKPAEMPKAPPPAAKKAVAAPVPKRARKTKAA